MSGFHALALLGLFLHGSCSGPDELLPGSLGGLTLSSSLAGAEARALVDRMHGKGVTPGRTAAGEYAGTGGRATLYVSEYSTPEAAREAETMMKTTMQEGNNVFSPVSDRTIDGHLIHMCTGLEQVHLFFASGQALYWLAVDPGIAEQTASALVQSARNEP